MPEFDFHQVTEGFSQSVAHKVYDAMDKQRRDGSTGYFELPYDSGLLRQVQAFKQRSSAFSNCENIAVVGIGGSSLGTKAIVSMLQHKSPRYKNIIFFENSDPIEITKNMQKLRKQNTVVIMVSKSGSTIETVSIFKTLCAHLKISFEKDAGRVAVVTDKDSVLDKFAAYYDIASFHIAGNVGGRFSVLSAVGIVPLCLAGYDTNALLEGARLMMDDFFDRKCDTLIQKAHYYAIHREQYCANVLFAYSSVLDDFVKWYVQLWGESLGKKDEIGQHFGPTPIGIIGSVDQHSFLQLLVDGPANKTVTFLSINDFGNDLAVADKKMVFLQKCDYINDHSFQTLINSQCEATKQSLDKLDIVTDKITLQRLDESEIGALIVYYELLTSVMGVFLRINTYDQPGVEEGKKILRDMFKGE